MAKKKRLCEYSPQLLNGDINPAESLRRRVNVAKILNMLPPVSGQKWRGRLYNQAALSLLLPWMGSHLVTLSNLIAPLTQSIRPWRWKQGFLSECSQYRAPKHHNTKTGSTQNTCFLTSICGILVIGDITTLLNYLLVFFHERSAI